MASRKSVTLEEQETIINFNKSETMASIFTYEETWQQHLEKRLGLKPVMNNGFGGKEYRIDKHKIKPPWAPKKLTADQKKKIVQQLAEGRRQKSLNSAPHTAPAGKSQAKTTQRYKDAG